MPYHPQADSYQNGDEQRPCVRGKHCAGRTITWDDGHRVETPAWTYRTFCDRCEKDVETRLKEFPDLWVRVHGELGVVSSGSDAPVSGSRAAPVPLSLGVDALLREVVAVLVSWEERVRIVARLAPLDTETSRRRRDRLAVLQACRTLEAHLGVLLALGCEPMARSMALHEAAVLPEGTPGVVHPAAGYAEALVGLDGGDAGLEILRLYSRCRSLLTDNKAPAKHLPVPCSGCEMKTLYEQTTWDGRPDGARCRNCGLDYSDNAYTLLRGQAYVAAREEAERGGPVRPRVAYENLSGRA